MDTHRHELIVVYLDQTIAVTIVTTDSEQDSSNVHNAQEIVTAEMLL